MTVPEGVHPEGAHPGAEAELEAEDRGSPPPVSLWPGGAPSGVARTGQPRVDEALARLVDLDGRAVADHVEIYEDVHRRLQEALADLDGG